MKTKFPSEKHYELLAKDFPSVDSDITKSYLEYILICQKTIAKIESYLSKIEMTNSQFLILLCLYVSDKNIDNITNISKKLGISNVTVSNVVKTLQIKGLVERKKLKEDKRFSRVVLNKKGKDFMKNFIPEYYSKYKGLFKEFDKEELLQLQFLIVKLNLAIESMSGKEKFWW
ncbi:transcriptional repressor MprA [Sebaldella termitidis]|uniref:Transcriptional regulator, MarR family n=1 Tax=Sebaldella termitidis (strain ATCC 33386 / NCTC 11300) TaxID=526218 RepID=D1AHC2_SEBTE|nr:MarR family transcriptional regulator [Sebaldella termitidis]ACZ08156.1 transcriptional regulator, MarR family [Sebaldella termitidis ATCC 33386]SUI23458.1 transcriptional repressor MprA [Sebaldella termitidis]